jgi:hypothetical protein
MNEMTIYLSCTELTHVLSIAFAASIFSSFQILFISIFYRIIRSLTAIIDPSVCCGVQITDNLALCRYWRNQIQNNIINTTIRARFDALRHVQR